MACHQHNSKLTIELLQDLSQTICDLWLTPTHLANPPKVPKGFILLQVVMVLQPHNSKLTIELLQDLDHSKINPINPNHSHTKPFQAWYNKAEFNV
jgi:hypothetical protein